MIFSMPVDVNIFDPGQYAQVRLPFLEASTLPPWCYTSEEFYQREVDRIFRRSWNFVGREDQIPHPGDYFTLEMFGESFIFIRDRSDRIHAFANTCRHRGCRLLSGEGNRASIICPYHAWTYGPNGDLIGMRGMEKTANFDAADYGLIPLRLESWAGFLFLNLDETAGPLQDYLGDLPEQFSSYGFSDMVCVRRKEYDLACNWKLYIENAMEDYHTAMVHNASIGDQETAPEKTVGQWDSIHMESDSTIAVLPGEEPPFAHVPTLRGKAASGTYFTVIYPSTFFATTQDCMWWLQQLPDVRPEPGLSSAPVSRGPPWRARISGNRSRSTTAVGTSRSRRTTRSRSSNSSGWPPSSANRVASRGASRSSTPSRTGCSIGRSTPPLTPDARQPSARSVSLQ